MKDFVKKIYKKIITNPYIILFIVTVLIMTPFIFSKNYVSGNDTEFHISNIYSMYTSMISGTVEKILPIIAHGFGYRNRNILSKISSYIYSNAYIYI